MEETSIRLQGQPSRSFHALALEQALKRALAIEHKLPPWLMSMPGMSGRKYRSFINNIIESLPGARYTEVGSWAGSTACSAMWENSGSIVCIDNWSQFGGPKVDFLRNVERARNGNIDFRFIESDFRQVAWSNLVPCDLYLFDGPHSEVDQYDGIVLAQPALADAHVLIVDDYNWPAVRNGTARAINDLNLKIDFSIEIRTTQNNTHPTTAQGAAGDWHNGYFMAALRKAG